MKQEKELLLKDLCARMPYGVKVHAKFIGKPNAQANISACALGKRKTAYGYGWTYVD